MRIRTFAIAAAALLAAAQAVPAAADVTAPGTAPGTTGQVAAGPANTPSVAQKAADQRTRAAVQKLVREVEVAQNRARVTAPRVHSHTH